MAFGSTKARSGNTKARSGNTTDNVTDNTTKTEFKPNLPLRIIGFCILGGIGFLMLLNLQPWLDVAELAAIRDERAYQNIANYIINNPAKWTKGKFSNQ